MTFTTMDKGRPGVWINFVEAASRAIEGSDGVVAMVMRNYNATATPGTLYEFDGLNRARQIIGTSNLKPVERAFAGGASKVLVYTQPEDAVDYEAAQYELVLQFFEAVTFDHPITTEQVTEWKNWLSDREEEDARHVLFYGVDEDEDVAAGIGRSNIDSSENVANLINAPKFGDETLASYEIAPYVAGLWAKTSLSQSITYHQVPNATDVNVRLTPQQISDAMTAGAIVFEYTGRNVRIVRGVNTAGSSLKRTAIKHTIARDWKFLIEEKYIGKVPNGPNQRLSMRADLTDYLTTLEAQGVIEANTWFVDVEQGNTKSQVVVDAFMVDLESMEEVYITIGLGA